MSTIDCKSFERWLDEGADPAFESMMRGHATACARCGAALAAMAEVDAWLSAAPAAPRGFADAVMARIDHPAPAPQPVVAEDMPWWVAILQQPAVVLAAVVAALVLWRADVLVAATAAAAAWLTGTAESFGGSALGWTTALGSHAPAATGGGAHPLVTLGLALGLAPVVAYASVALGGWVTRWVTRRVLAA